MEKSLPQAAVVIVNYNTGPETEGCIASLRRLHYTNRFLVVVDNASPDGSGRILQDLFEDEAGIKVILNPENRGFAAGVNVGIAYARACRAEFVWLLNPDTSVEPEALTALIDYASAHPETAACGSKILCGPAAAGKTPCIWGIGGEVDFSRCEVCMPGSGQPDEGQFNEPFSCAYLPGCSLLLRCELLPVIGMLREDYFMYFEETDWCARAKSSGFELAAVPSSVIWHNFNSAKLSQPFMTYYYNRNSYFFWWRFGSRAAKKNLLKSLVLKRLPQSIHAFLRAPSASERRIFACHIAAIADFLSGRAGRRREVRQEQ